MTRSKTATKIKHVVEMGHDSNDVITIDTIKSIFQEMFQQQEKVLIETVNSASLVTNQRLDKLSSDITVNNEKLIKLENDTSDVQLSIEASQEMVEEKIKKIEERIDKEKQKNMRHCEKIEDENKGVKDKLRDLEDRSRRDNLRFDEVKEYENESWNDTEEILKDFLFEHLGLRNIKIERAHRTGERKEDTSRTIVAEFSSYKTKETTLKNAGKLKDTGYYINEGFSNENVEIRKENWRKVKEPRKNGKYAILVYDKVF